MSQQLQYKTIISLLPAHIRQAEVKHQVILMKPKNQNITNADLWIIISWFDACERYSAWEN